MNTETRPRPETRERIRYRKKLSVRILHSLCDVPLQYVYGSTRMAVSHTLSCVALWTGLLLRTLRDRIQTRDIYHIRSADWAAASNYRDCQSDAMCAGPHRRSRGMTRRWWLLIQTSPHPTVLPPSAAAHAQPRAAQPPQRPPSPSRSPAGPLRRCAAPSRSCTRRARPRAA